MKRLTQMALLAAVGMAWTGLNCVSAQDWNQWRGNGRDAIAADFQAPESWPKNLSRTWSVTVGDGVSSPSILDGKLYIIAFQEGNEVMRCLDAMTGEEVWQDSYPARPASGPAAGFPGTRSSPAVANNRVVALGVNGTLSCWNVSDGKLAWRNEDFKGQIPRFSTSSSPLIADGTCFVQFGSEDRGGIAAYDLDSGVEKWKWTGDGTSYGSPVLMSIDDQPVLLAPTARRLVILDISSGDELWEMEYRQGRYNAATPVVEGQTAYFAGPERGMTAIEFSMGDGKINGQEKWRNDDTNVTTIYNSPVLAGGMLFGLSTTNSLFCVDTGNGSTAWNQPIGTESPGSQQTGEVPRGGARPGGGERGDARPGSGQRGGAQPGGRRGGGRGGRGGGGRGGYGSIVYAGSVLLGLTPASELVVYPADGSGFTELARYKVSETPTYAYPVPVGNRIYIKDKDALTMWEVK